VRSRRLLGAVLIAAAIPLGTSAVAAAQTTTPPTTPPTTPTGTACTKDVTYTLLKSRKPGKVIVTVDRANVRRLPGTDCTIYASVKRKAKFKTTGRRARANKLTWIEVYNDTLGHVWVAAKLVKSVK
jgi:hypothetical protein